MINQEFRITPSPNDNQVFTLINGIQNRYFYLFLEEGFYACFKGQSTIDCIAFENWAQKKPIFSYRLSIIYSAYCAMSSSTSASTSIVSELNENPFAAAYVCWYATQRASTSRKSL